MSRSLVRWVSLFSAVVLVAGVLGGCKEKPAPKVKSVWPTAEAERTVSKPKGPPRWPLTGKDAPSHRAVARRVISIKIENSSAARPQHNLEQADVVYETLTEGGITRFNALFHSRFPDRLGPVRSARISDTHIVPQYDGLFVFAGASGAVNRQIAKAKLPNLSEDIGVTSIYSRGSDRPAPHNLYVDVKKVYAEAKSRRMRVKGSTRSFAFDRSGAEPTRTVEAITIPFDTDYKVKWSYDSDSKRYERTNNGEKHYDRASGDQYTARNVIVIWAKTRETKSRDVTGTRTLNINLSGDGKATVFRDGAKFDCEWTANGKKHIPPRFKAKDGTLVKLAPGNTWIEVIPTSGNITME